MIVGVIPDSGKRIRDRTAFSSNHRLPTTIVPSST